MIAVNAAPLPIWSGGDPNEAGAPTDPSAELLALWQAVFLNSHAVSAGMHQDAPGRRESSPPQPSLGVQDQDRQSSREAEARQGSDAGESSDTADRFAPPLRVDMEALPTAQDIDSILPSLARSVSGSAEVQKWSASRPSGPDRILGTAGDERLPVANVATEELEPAAEPKLLEPREPSAAEAVSVFSHGTGIAIVVRDNSLSRAEALRCAFETAQQLTGRRSTLELLTLNGRILYQQASAPQQAPSSKQLWKMVC